MAYGISKSQDRANKIGHERFLENQEIKRAPIDPEHMKSVREETSRLRAKRKAERLAEYEASGFEGTQEEYVKDRTSRNKYQRGVDNFSVHKDTDYDTWKAQQYDVGLKKTYDQGIADANKKFADKARHHMNHGELAGRNAARREARSRGLKRGTPEYLEFIDREALRVRKKLEGEAVENQAAHDAWLSGQSMPTAQTPAPGQEAQANAAIDDAITPRNATPPSGVGGPVDPDTGRQYDHSPSPDGSYSPLVPNSPLAETDYVTKRPPNIEYTDPLQEAAKKQYDRSMGTTPSDDGWEIPWWLKVAGLASAGKSMYDPTPQSPGRKTVRNTAGVGKNQLTAQNRPRLGPAQPKLPAGQPKLPPAQPQLRLDANSRMRRGLAALPKGNIAAGTGAALGLGLGGAELYRTHGTDWTLTDPRNKVLGTTGLGTALGETARALTGTTQASADMFDEVGNSDFWSEMIPSIGESASEMWDGITGSVSGAGQKLADQMFGGPGSLAAPDDEYKARLRAQRAARIAAQQNSEQGNAFDNFIQGTGLGSPGGMMGPY